MTPPPLREELERAVRFWRARFSDGTASVIALCGTEQDMSKSHDLYLGVPAATHSRLLDLLAATAEGGPVEGRTPPRATDGICTDHTFAEEREPSGRLILGPCLTCGLSAMDGLAAVKSAKDGAYSERNRLVAFLSRLYPSSLERHPESEPWEDDWRWIVFVALPTGQASWHIHDSELPRFAHLPRNLGTKWDGHTNEEKYARLDATPRAQRRELLEEAAKVCDVEAEACEALLREARDAEGARAAMHRSSTARVLGRAIRLLASEARGGE